MLWQCECYSNVALCYAIVCVVCYVNDNANGNVNVNVDVDVYVYVYAYA